MITMVASNVLVKGKKYTPLDISLSTDKGTQFLLYILSLSKLEDRALSEICPL